VIAITAEACVDNPYRGGSVSWKSVASLVVKLATTPALEIHHSLGVSKPE
jgi:hypothetical protein